MTDLEAALARVSELEEQISQTDGDRERLRRCISKHVVARWHHEADIERLRAEEAEELAEISSLRKLIELNEGKISRVTERLEYVTKEAAQIVFRREAASRGMLPCEYRQWIRDTYRDR
jgi:chromosome segregation ATPase